MADRPIIFSAPMVRALLEGRKTQTRRLLKVPGIMGGRYQIFPPEEAIELEDGEFRSGVFHYLSTGALSGPYRVGYAVGDRLYVREHWKTSVGNDGVAPHALDQKTPVRYLADGAERTGYPVLVSGKHRQGMHMPRWASRITLLVEEVRVQQLQECSVEDAIAEGASCWICGGRIDGTSENDCNCFHSTQEAIQSYSFLWDTLHGDGSWDANPWVVAVTFRVERCNIDQMPTPPSAAILGG